MRTALSPHAVLFSLTVVAAMVQPAKAQGARPGAPLGGTWLGQDGGDHVGPSSVPAPSDVQDVHILIVGLPPARTIKSAVVKGLGGDEWQYNGPHGPFRAEIVRAPKSTKADLYIEPTRVETGRPFTVSLTFDDGRSVEFNVKGGKADPNLRMKQASLRVGWIGQGEADRVGTGPSVGPDGTPDAVLSLTNLSPKVEIQSVSIVGTKGEEWRSGVNLEGKPTAEFLRSGKDPSRGELYFNPDRDLKGRTLDLIVTYAHGKTDKASVVAGKFDPKLRVPTPPIAPLTASRMTAKWLKQDDALPGHVHVALNGVPAGRTVVAAILNDSAGTVWVYRVDDKTPIHVEPFSRSLELLRERQSSKAILAFDPIRDETGSTLTLRLVFDDGKTTVVTVPGGRVDLSRRAKPVATTSTRAKPGDDLHALASRFGKVVLTKGTYRLDRPLVLDGPVALIGEPSATLVFSQGANNPPWSAAIKIHSGNTTLENLAVRFAGPIRWAKDVQFGPAVVGSTDNQDQNHHDLKANVVLRGLDLESPPASGAWEEAPRLIRLGTADSGTIERNTLRGGITEVVQGPWRIIDNDYRGTVPNTFAFSVFSVHNTHDLILERNRARPIGRSGKTWRFLVMTGSGYNDLIADNNVVEIGPRDDDTIPGANAPEIVLTEAYSLHFEGKPSAVSTDGRILRIPPPQGEPARSGAVVAILTGPHAGQWRRISQAIDPRTYLLQEALPTSDSVVSIATGFVVETYRGNTLDSRGSSVAANLVLVGNHFGTVVSKNNLLGAGEAFKIAASPTESPVSWGWSHAPFLGGRIEGNVLEDSLRGGNLVVEHSPAIKSNRGRVYMSVDLKDNVVRWSDAFRDRQGGKIECVGVTVGDRSSLDPGELVLSESNNLAEGRALIKVNAAIKNGRASRDESSVLPTRGATASAAHRDGD